MAGSNHFSINRDSESFARSFKKLCKVTARGILPKLISQLEFELNALSEQPRPQSSRFEPVPKKITLPQSVEFRKLVFKVSKGASGQIRLMYVIDTDRREVLPFFIYSHEQFVGRPSDQNISAMIEDLLT